MTKKLLSLISGLLIMLLSISSLYAQFKYEDSGNYIQNTDSNSSTIVLFKSKAKERNKETALFMTMVSKIGENYILAVGPHSSDANIKNLFFKVLDYNDNTVFYYEPEKANNGVSFYTVDEHRFKYFIENDYYFHVTFNKKFYKIYLNKFYVGDFKENVEKSIVAKKKQEEEENYKNSFEYVYGTPTLEEIRQYERAASLSNDLNGRYINTYGFYANEASGMGLKNTFQRDLYFLYRYSQQVSKNPGNVYNVKIAKLNIANNNQNKDLLIYLRSNGEPFQMACGGTNITHLFNGYVFVDFAFNSGGFSGLEKAHSQGYLNSVSTVPVLYLLSGNNKIYLYQRDALSKRYFIIWNNEVFGPISVY